ncbi:MAG TPA: DNA-3-methyladenine glycosylase 2 family protein [Casimicrobiaceae bacterium]|nr:DNA-3-methyladenine glycosylase 2 family protein [Casimicrobiaceae bacterium]
MAAAVQKAREDDNPMKEPNYWSTALAALRRADPVMARLIDAYPGLYLTRRSDAFTALCRAISGQQISVKAADAIWRRFVARVVLEEPDAPFPELDPARVATLSPVAMRECGFSVRKGEYLRDLAMHFVSGRLDPKHWRSLDDEALIEALCDVKGIGRWTAEMFLIFHELRPDVFPIDDLGLQKAIAHNFHGGRRVTVRTMRRHGNRWKPWRSVATWYLWRSLDPIAVEY